MQCDERRPVCSNCVRQHTVCEYGQPARSPAASSPGDHGSAAADKVFDSLDLLLMHRFSTVTARELIPSPDAQHCWQNVAPQWAHDHDFLLHGILALASMDLARTDADKRALYRTRALYHQQAVLASFQDVLSQHSPEHIEPIFYFSVILIILAFASPQMEAETPSIDGILDLFGLFRGPKTLAQYNWEAIRDSVVQPLFGTSYDAPASDIPERVRAHFEGLRMERDEIDEKAWTILVDGVSSSLQYPDLRHIGRWPSMISEEFFGRLRAHESQALIMLAQFSITVKSFERYWWLLKWDQMIVRAVDHALSDDAKKRYNWNAVEMQHLLDSINE